MIVRQDIIDLHSNFYCIKILIQYKKCERRHSGGKLLKYLSTLYMDCAMQRYADISDDVLIALRKIIQAIDLNSKQLVKRVGLTGPQLVILQYISSSDRISVGEVAKNVSLSQGTVTGIIERMEKRDLITRQRGLRDKRRVMVQITESGKALLETAPPVMQESFLKKFKKKEDWEQTMILSALQRLVYMMDATAISAAPFLSAAPLEIVVDNQKQKAGSDEKE